MRIGVGTYLCWTIAWIGSELSRDWGRLHVAGTVRVDGKRLPCVMSPDGVRREARASKQF